MPAIETLNLEPVPSRDVKMTFIVGKALRIADGCEGCEFLTEDRIASDLGLVGGMLQPTLDDRGTIRPDRPRQQKDLIHEDATTRCEAGISGECRAIKEIDDCWRRKPIIIGSEEYEFGRHLANKSNHTRDEALRLRREAERDLSAAERLSVASEDKGVPEHGIQPSSDRAQFFKEQARRATANEVECWDSFEMQIEAASHLLDM